MSERMLKCPHCMVAMRSHAYLHAYECPLCVFSISDVGVEAWRRLFGDRDDQAPVRQALARMGRPRYDAFGCDQQPDIDRKSFKPRMRRLSELKHGPNGRGGPGACDANCRKCTLEAVESLERAKAAKEVADACVANKDAVHPTIQLFRDAKKYHDAQQAYAVAPVPPACAPAGNPKPTGVSHCYAATMTPPKDADAFVAGMAKAIKSSYERITITPITVSMTLALGPCPQRGIIEIDGELPVDPLDVEYDGVTLRELVERYEVLQRDDRNSRWAGAHRSGMLTRDQRAAVSAHWSAQLRAKVAASAERARSQVVVDLQDEP